jgi:hypothetical protein
MYIFKYIPLDYVMYFPERVLPPLILTDIRHHLDLYILTYIYIYVYLYIYMYINMHKCMNMNINIHIYVYVNIHI